MKLGRRFAFDPSTPPPSLPASSSSLQRHTDPARYHPKLGCVFYDDRVPGHGGRREILAHLPAEATDVVILEEPEHINWHHNGARWAHRFNYVVGIGHTNYMQYTFEAPVGGW